MAAKGTFGYFFALEKVSRCSGAKARIINFYYYFLLFFFIRNNEFTEDHHGRRAHTTPATVFCSSETPVWGRVESCV